MTDTTVRPFAVVTGASSGIGLELARQLAARDFDVLMVAENDQLAAAAGTSWPRWHLPPRSRRRWQPRSVSRP